MKQRKKKTTQQKVKTLEEKYIEIATWDDCAPIDDRADLSQPEADVDFERPQIKTYVTYGVPPGL